MRSGVPLRQAIQEAQSLGVDLVQVSPSGKLPAVCRLFDAKKRLYELKKATKKASKQQKPKPDKEVVVGAKIAPNDLKNKVDQLKRFLTKGHKVKVTIKFDQAYHLKQQSIEQLERIGGLIDAETGVPTGQPREQFGGVLASTKRAAPALEQKWGPETCCLNVDNSRKLLDAVKQQVALLDGVLVLRVLGIWAELHAHTKGGSHGGNGDTAVSLQELTVGEHTQLAVQEARVGGQVLVPQDVGLDVHHGSEEPLVVAVVESVEEVREARDLVDDRQDLGRVHDFLLQVHAAHAQHTRDDAVEDHRVVRHQLRGRERGHRLLEELGRLLEVARHQQVAALVHFEAVAAVPVAALVDQPAVKKQQPLSVT
ncbi:hypothetical protein ON010_g18082 [Phytophthora cinnamomi]|nr:hypothetical protein ON010_g18082 [Phytophthora cinnamomi]